MPTFELDPMMMREIIMDHYANPRHFGVPAKPEEYEKVHADSDNCIDDFDLYLKYENGKVTDAMFNGVACTISKASTDILCDLLIGKEKEKAFYIIDQFLAMIAEKPFDQEALDEALAFKNTGRQAGRIHCATMGWTAVAEMLKKEDK